MPNWCLNKITIAHDDPAMVDRFEQAYNAGKTCNEFIPMPEDIGDGWYDWCVNNWGTKWDVGADTGTEKEERYGLKATRVGNQLSASFDSAWAPPIPLYDKLTELEFKVRASYFEPGMCFCGIYTDGRDNFVEYADIDLIPNGIWRDYNLAEFYAEEPDTKEECQTPHQQANK
jgi:hypothetical protein